ncbi:MAG: starch-binding protein [Oscillospiraceae bacterium]|nr:starch-binding protein [Oscillospiraceae bacterium]
MKKTIAILAVLVLLLAAFPVTATAAEATEMIPVVVSVPEGWNSPNLWAWADDGTNAFAAWPGEALEELAEGWYYVYVPNYVQNVIVNANQGEDTAVQTDAIAVEAGKEVWITVAEDLSATVSYEAQLRGEIPAYVEKFVIHAYVPLSWKTVNLWAWSAPDGTNAFESWPGELLTEGEDGWFTGKAPTWINSLIINGNEGTVQTADIAVEGKELWITVYEDLSYELSYEDPNKAVEPITVYAKVPADWAAPCCWAWSAPDGTNAFTSWPGEALTQDGDWYAIEVPGWINSVIINANEGTVQTSDLAVEAGKDVWIVVTDAENATVSYEEPAAEVTDPVTEPSEEDTQPTETPTEPQEPVTEEPEKKSNTGLIVGIVAAAVVVLGGGAALILKKKKK